MSTTPQESRRQRRATTSRVRPLPGYITQVSILLATEVYCRFSVHEEKVNFQKSGIFHVSIPQ